MYSITYFHGGATDIWNTGTEEEAINSIIDTIFDNLDELSIEETKDVFGAIEAGEFKTAVEKYCNYMSESFQLERSNIVDTSSKEALISRAQRVLNETYDDFGDEQETASNE